MNVYATKIPRELTSYEFQQYIDKIPVERQERVLCYVRKEDAIRSLVGILLIQKIISKELGIDSGNLTFSYNEYGKPSVRELPDFHYNLSHSGEWVVCATDNESIGIDIEQIKPIDLETAKNFFSKDEYQYIYNKPSHERLSVFYEYWTLKESFIKAVGKGLTIPLDSFSIVKKDKEYYLQESSLSQYSFYLYNIDQSYKLAVCTSKEVIKPEIIYFCNQQF